MGKRAKIITFSNQKGGVGKTTNSTLISYHLAKRNFKTLLVDLDPQGHSSKILFKTKMVNTGVTPVIDVSFMKSIVDGLGVDSTIHNIMENLDIIPNTVDFTVYGNYLESTYPDNMLKRIKHLDKLLEPLKDKYDFIIFDVPPTISIYTDSALYISDYAILVLQTEELSLDGAEKFIEYLQTMVDEYDIMLDVLGVLPVLLSNRSKVDEAILEIATEKFGEENMFNVIVKRMERIKRFSVGGITDSDRHDRKVHNLYEKVVDEILTRIGKDAEIYGFVNQ